jgi:hypothetical protein
MANPTTFPGDVVIPGTLRVTGAINPTRLRSEILMQKELQPFAVPWSAWRVWDALTNNPPSAGGTDDLALIGGTFGTNPPSIQTGDVKAAGAVTRYLRCQIPLPWEYESAESVTIRVHAGMLTTVAATSATVDIEAYRSTEENGISADLCTTSAQSINSLVFADKDFVITPTLLVPGNFLDIRMTIATSDGATGTAVIGCVGSVKLLCDVR